MASEYYPPNLKYSLNVLNSFSRMRNKLTLPFVNGRQNEIIWFRLPSNTMVDLSTLSFHFDITTTATTSYAVPSQYTASLIEALDISINGQVVQSIPYYNQLFKLMGNYQCGDMAQRNGFLEWFGMTTVAPSANTIMGNSAGTQGVSLAIKNWLGLLGSNRIVDTSLLGDVQVNIRLAPNASLIAIAGSNPSYTISNMSVQFDSVNFTSPAYQQGLYRQMETDGLKWAYQNVISNAGNLQSVAACSQTFSVSTQSLDYIVSTLLQGSYNTIATSTALQTLTGCSTYFTHGDTGLTSGQFTIGSVTLPNFKASGPEMLSYTFDSLGLSQESLGRSFDNFRPISGGAAMSGTNWLNSNQYLSYLGANFAFIARLCHGDKSNGPLVSGLSTAGTNTAINVRYEATTSTNVIPLTFAICTSMITIYPGRQISYTQ